jgi:tape measure domain-containing protein
MDKRYTVTIHTALDNKALKSGEREHVSAFERIAEMAAKAARKEAEAFEKSNISRVRSFQSAIRSIDREEQQHLTSVARATQLALRQQQQADQARLRSFQQSISGIDRAEQQRTTAASRAAQQRIREEEQVAREVQRINAQITRQAEQQARIQERAAKSLADEKQRLIRREQDAFLRAEAEKTTAARAASAAQIASAERTRAALVAIWGTIKAAAVATFAGILAAGGGLGIAISRAMSMDALVRGLTVVAGSAEKAQEQLKQLREIAKQPGIGFREAITGAIGLQVAFKTVFTDINERAKVSQKILVEVANAVAVSGKSKPEFDRVLIQLAQMASAGKVLTADLRPIIQAAPAMADALLRAFGTINAGDIEKLNLSSKEFFARLITGLEGLDRAAGSSQNSWDNFTDSLDIALLTIGKPFLDPLIRGLDAISPLLQSVADQVSSVFTMIGEDAVKLWANLPAATKAAFADVFSTVTGLGGQIVQWFRDNYQLIQEVVVNVLNKIAGFWQENGANIKEGYTATLKSLLEVAQMYLQILKGDWKSAWESLGTTIMAQGPRIKAVATFLFKILFDVIWEQRALIAKAGIGLGEALVDGIKQGIKNKAQSAIDSVSAMGNGLVLAARQALLIHSPSQVFFEIGVNIMQGLDLGLQSGAIAVGKTMNAIMTRVRSVAKDLVRERRTPMDLGGGSFFFPEMDVSRPRRAEFDPGSTTRPRAFDPVDLQLGQTYANILSDLNGRLAEHVNLTNVERVAQQLQAAGLGDLTDARAQEALAIASQIDQEDELFKMRDRIRGVAEDISSVFARAVQDWSGSFGKFFKNIGRGFADLLKDMLARVVFSRLSNVFEGIFGRIFGIGGTQQAGGGGGFGGILSSIFGGGTPGFAGGPGAGQFFGGGGLFGLGLAAPPSSSGQAATWARFAQLIPGAPGVGGVGGSGGSAGFSLAGLAESAPFLGAALGVGIGSSFGRGASPLASVLGGVGLGAVGLVAGQAIPSILAGSFAGLTALGAATFGIGAALAVAAFIIGKNAQRRKEEKIRTQLAGDALTQVYQVLWAAQRGELNLSQARSQYDQIHQAYLAQVAGLKDSKTRRNATLWWNDVDRDVWPKIEAAAKAGQEAKAFSAQFVPTFAGGGVFRAAHGLMNIPGVFDRRDDMLMRVSRGEHVAVMNPDQFNRIGGTRTFQAAGVPAFASGAVTGATGSPSRQEPITVHINVTNAIGKNEASQIFVTGAQSSDGRRVIVNATRDHVAKERTEGLAGDIELVLTRR